MSKNINVEGHISRYEDTDLNQVLGLITGLQDMVERRRAEAIADMEAKLALLKKGEIPAEEPKPETVKRTRKKKVTETTEE